MSQNAKSVLGATPDDEGEKVVLRYQSRYHPDADKTRVEGEIDDVQPSYGRLYIEDGDGRGLEVSRGKVRLNTDAEGNYRDRTIGDAPEVEVKRLFKVYVDGTTVKHVRAEDEDTARDHAHRVTDFGEMNDMTDANAASRTSEVEPAHGDVEVHDA